MFHEGIYACHVTQPDGSRPGRTGRQPVEIHLLTSVVRAQPHDVSLFRHDVRKFVLFEEAPNRRMLLGFFRASLNGDHQGISALELPTQEWMRDCPRAPIRQKQIQPADAREIVGPIFVAHLKSVSEG